MDDDEDLVGDIDALVVGRAQLKKDEASGQAFLREWCAFESAVALFFGKMDARYRAELRKPLMSNAEANLDALKRVAHGDHCPKLFKSVLDFLAKLGELRKAGALKWSGLNVWHEEGCARRFFMVHEGFFVPINDLPALTQRCQKLTDEMGREYEAYRDFEENLQMLVMIVNQRQRLAPESRAKADAAYGTLCDVHACNLKLDKKLQVGFQADGMDVQFKAPPTVSQTYDLSKTCAQHVASAVAQCQEPLHELLQAMRARHKEKSCKDVQ